MAGAASKRGEAAAEGLPLTERMRKGTRQIHDKSDKLVNLKLALVLTSKLLYGEAISLFAPIYAKLEEILGRQAVAGGHPELSKLARFLPTLRRSEGFEADLRFFLGSEQLAATKERWQRGEPPELAAYLSRLEELERSDPILLLAYAYHMYLAIFAGGYQIRRAVKKALGLTGDEGVRTFCFDGLGSSTKSFREEYKHAINTELSVTEEEVSRLLEESTRVFAQNNALVATVQSTQAFATASADCTSWMLKCSAGVLVVAMAVKFGWAAATAWR